MQMDELTQQNAALVEEATAASQAMASQARDLDSLLTRYQVSGGQQTRRDQDASEDHFEEFRQTA
jgi:methyl-accepting chemotaxis protein